VKNTVSPLAPAQIQLNTIAQQEAQKQASFWFPIHQYFAQRLKDSKEPEKKEAEGEMGASARSQVSGLIGKTATHDAATGAAPGSGKFVTDTSKGFDVGAGAAANAVTQAASSSDRAYVKGLQDVVSLGLKDQSTAQRGLATAAETEAQEAGLATQINYANQSGDAAAIGGGVGQLAANPAVQNFVKGLG
jgi:hypothetical protein